MRLGLKRVARVVTALGAVLVVGARVMGAGAGVGILGVGAVEDEASAFGPGVTHGWIVLPLIGNEHGAEVWHLPPRGVFSDRDGSVVGAHAGEMRQASVLTMPPLAVAAHGSHLAMVFGDPGGVFPLRQGRTLLSLSAVATAPGVWETAQKGRLEALPSLRGDGILLGFAGSDVGYCALYQGLTAEKADPTRLVLQVLGTQGWVDVAVPAEAQAMAGECYTPGAGGKTGTVSAAWHLFETPDGIGMLVVPPKGAVFGTLLTAKLAAAPASSPAGTGPTALWSRGDVKLSLPDGAVREHVTALYAADHVVVGVQTRARADKAHEGTLHVFARPLRFPELEWRELATLAGVSTDYAMVGLDGVGRVAVVSAPVPTMGQREREKLGVTEVSVRTGAEAYAGEMVVSSPISKQDYRMVGVILGYALGLVLIFLVKTPGGDVVLLPEGYSIAEPARRAVAGVIDFIVAVVLGSEIWHMPLGDALTPTNWMTETGQATVLTTVGLLIVLGTALEFLFGRSLGKIITGCEVVGLVEVGVGVGVGPAPQAGEAPAGQERPALWRLLVRNAVKWGLPPVALFGLIDAGGRHRGDQLARTAVVVEGVEEEEGEDGDGEE